MKSKISKIMGIGFALVLIFSMMMFAVPTSADPYEPPAPAVPNMWEAITPTPGGPPLDAWFNDPTITKVGPIAQSPVDGDLYASVNFGQPLETLGTSGGTSTATWSFDMFESPDYSAELNFVDAHVYVDITSPVTGYTFASLDAAADADFGFFYYQTTQAGFGPQLELKFVDPLNALNYIDLTLMLQANTTLNQWTGVNLGSTFGAIGTWDGAAFTPYATVQLAITAMVAAHPTYTLTKARVELYNDPAPARVAYIDDVVVAGTCFGFDPVVKFLKSTDGGRAWAESTSPYKYFGGPVVDMVCSSLFEDVIYVTDGNYVYKSVDGGISFGYVAKDDLEKNLIGDCGCGICAKPITCIDVGYDGGDKPVVFIGTRQLPGRIYIDPHPWAGDFVVGSIYWIADETFPASWHDLELKCYGCCDPELADASQTGCFDVYAVATAPGFSTSNKVYAVVTTDDLSCDGVATTDPATHVISTVGTTCSWNFVTELCWNCAAANSFEIRHSSRIVFPSYYATTPTLFVGVAGTYNGVGLTYGPGGDVYRVSDTFPPTPMAIDLNVQGFAAGCIGLYHANICSLDIENDALVAGAYDIYQYPQTGTNVYYSADNGWSWAPSLKDPTGVDQTYVLFGGSIVAGTRHCDCGFSLDCGATPAQYFNQISLINMDIDQTLDLSHSPGYVTGSSTMYVLTNDDDACLRTDTQDNSSLLRYDGMYWERVFSSLSHEYEPSITDASDPQLDWVEVSPDFNDTSCVYLANTSFDMFRSLDAGCSWAPLTFPCAPKPKISAWIVVDLETVLASGGTAGAGTIYRTMYHGAQPWTPFPVPSVPAFTADYGVDFDLSPTIATDDTVIFGDQGGNVFISTDLGATWAEIKDAAGFVSFHTARADTYVVFDPGYGTADDPGENTIYAAAGSVIGRCTINHDALMATQDWLYLGGGYPAPMADCDAFDLCLASGIDASGDTCLYVSDAGVAADQGGGVLTGTMGVSYECGSEGPVTCTCDLDLTGSTVETLVLPVPCGEPLVMVNYNLVCDASGVAGTVTLEGAVSGGMIKVTVDEALLDACTACSDIGSFVTYINSELTLSCVTTTYCPTGVWRTLNPLALISEPSGLNFVEFEFLDLSAVSPLSSLRHPVADSSFSVYPDDLWLTLASNMLWALDFGVSGTLPETIWMWEDTLAAPVTLVAPADGAALVTPTTTTLEWEALDNATMYEVYVYSYCASCPLLKNLEYEILTPFTCLPLYPDYPLLPGTTYYWKVRVACDSPYVSKWSDLREFDTALGSITNLCSPICGSADIILTTNFSWDIVLGAAGYELQLVAASADGTSDFTGATTYTSDVNALASIPGLEYSTVYYWRVRAIKDGVAGAWAVCLFTTMDEPVPAKDPITPVTIVTEEVTPMWIWVIIGIGGALTIAVIILIVTTRRVP